MKQTGQSAQVPVRSSGRIEICGGIASGKTTLATALQQRGSTAIYERFRETPFWRAFYDDPQRYGFEAEVDFLLQHYHQIKSSHPRTDFVCDYSLWLDRAYANTNLNEGQRAAFEAVWKQAFSELGVPAVLVHLRCDHEVLLERVLRRARAEEMSISAEYLSSLNVAIDDQVSALAQSVPIVEIDSARHDFTEGSLRRSEILLALENALQERLERSERGVQELKLGRY